MTGKAIWKGNIRFRNIDIPVKLHTAVKEERISFHLLHKKDHTRLRQQMVCAYEKVPVAADEQVRGFKLDNGKYVLVETSELKQTEPEDSRFIEVHEFVKSAQIDPVYISRSYYLEPDTGSKVYHALALALSETNVEGICTWTMRKHTYLGALQICGKILRLNTLRYADELIKADALELERMSLSEKELQIGSDLINRLTAEFSPQKYVNEHQIKLQKLIDKKARGEKILILRPKRVTPTKPDKLLQALEASLKKVA